jgi:hypothetical protein
MRRAAVQIGNGSISTIERLLPWNYRVVETDGSIAVVEGEDRAGWTLDDYVIPRLASGLYFATELDPSDGEAIVPSSNPQEEEAT